MALRSQQTPMEAVVLKHFTSKQEGRMSTGQVFTAGKGRIEELAKKGLADFYVMLVQEKAKKPPRNKKARPYATKSA